MKRGVTFTFLYNPPFLGILLEGEISTKPIWVTQYRLPNIIVQM